MNSDKPAALVTGAATGIGRSVAIALAKNGYDVVVNYSRSEDAAKFTAREAEAAGARTLLYRADVSDDASVRAMLAATEKEFGRLDVLINNAGTTVDVEPKNFEEMTVDAWNRVFSVNVLGLFLVTRAATPLSIACWMSRCPGSETVGVPASDTRAMASPRINRPISDADLAASLCSWRLVVGVWIPYRVSNWAVRRVSSAAMSATSRSTRSARVVMSSRLPIGVATTKSVPGIDRAAYCTIQG